MASSKRSSTTWSQTEDAKASGVITGPVLALASFIRQPSSLVAATLSAVVLNVLNPVGLVAEGRSRTQKAIGSIASQKVTVTRFTEVAREKKLVT